jgi:hypothetical protein
VNTPRKPDLDQLVTALTADGRREELAGRDAALAAFRAAGQRDAADAAAARRQGARFRWPLVPRARLAAAGAALVVAAGVAAAYAQALPSPVQQFAHTVLAPLGVQGSQQPGDQSPGTAPATGSTGITIASTGGKGKKASPSASDAYRVTVAVSRTRVPPGGRVAFTGQLTDHGQVAPRARVRLYERLAGSTQFTLVATELTGPRGGYKLTSAPMTATAIFRVVGPDSAHSVAVRVTVTASAS